MFSWFNVVTDKCLRLYVLMNMKRENTTCGNICMFIIASINTIYFPTQHYAISLCDEEAMCSLRSRKGFVVYYVSEVHA